MIFDSTYILLLPAIILSLWAQFKINSTFNEYSKIRCQNGFTGAQVARTLLDSAGLFNVPVEVIDGKLTDHYDPVNKVMRLSKDVFYGSSIASIGVAAHETGHAIQHKSHYAPLEIRNSIVPVVNFSSSASWIIFFLGMVLGILPLARLGILLFSAVVIFQLITLPVEFNASNRAIKILGERSILYPNEINGARNVLNAAAMTYVAATLMAVSQLLQYIVLTDRRD